MERDPSDDEMRPGRHQPAPGYEYLSRGMLHQFFAADITFEFLKGHSTNHKTPLTAFAELTDNSRDAGAKNVSIDLVRRDGRETIEVLDDGIGMTRDELLKTMVFGHSTKILDYEKYIGRYGNGLKAGGFRIGGDMMVVTKKNEITTVLLVSTEFHRKEDVDNRILFPIPSFDANKQPITKNRAIHDAEVKTILMYGPLNRDETMEMLLDRIKGPSGTLIIIERLKRVYMGVLELTTSTQNKDIVVESEGKAKEESERSLRQYMSNLYYQSNMNIRIQGKLVKPRILPEFWMFKTTKTVDKMYFPQQWKKYCQDIAKEVETLTKQQNELKKELPKRNFEYEATTSLLESMQNKKKISQGLNGGKIEVQFGLNVKDRSNNGVYFYVNGRRIIGNFKEMRIFKNQKNLNGVCAIVHLTYLNLKPNSSKVEFENRDDFNKLVRGVSDGLEKYVWFLGEEALPKLIVENFNVPEDSVSTPDDAFSQFWKTFGYSKSIFSVSKIDWKIETKQSRAMEEDCHFWRQCVECHHWIFFFQKPDVEVYRCPDNCVAYSDKVYWKPLQEPKEWKKKKNPVFRTPQLPREESYEVEMDDDEMSTSPAPSIAESSSSSIPTTSERRASSSVARRSRSNAAYELEDTPEDEPTSLSRMVRNARRRSVRANLVVSEEPMELMFDGPFAVESDEEEQVPPKKSKTNKSNGAVASRSFQMPASPAPSIARSLSSGRVARRTETVYDLEDDESDDEEHAPTKKSKTNNSNGAVARRSIQTSASPTSSITRSSSSGLVARRTGTAYLEEIESDEEEHAPTKKSKANKSNGAVARRSTPMSSSSTPFVAETSSSSSTPNVPERPSQIAKRKGFRLPKFDLLGSIIPLIGESSSSSSSFAFIGSNRQKSSSRVARRTGTVIPAPVQNVEGDLNSFTKMIGEFMEELQKLKDPQLVPTPGVTDPVEQLMEITENLKRNAAINNNES